jgi:competence protein ComEC
MLPAACRHDVIDHWRRALPWEQSGVMEALLIGARVDLPHRVADDFESTGTIHLLATAGLHVGLLAALLISFWRYARIPRRAGLLLTIAAEILYAMVAGGRPSIVRAAIVVSVVLFGMFLEREPDLPNALSLAAFGLLLYDPRNLSDPGFQLSFATVITIVLLMPYAEGLLNRIGRRRNDGLPETAGIRWLRRGLQLVAAALFVAVAAQIGSAPLVAYYFNTLSPISPVANTLVVPITPLLLACGFSGTVVGALYTPLALPFDAVTRLLVAYMLGATHFCAALPWSSVSVMSPPVPLIVAYYAVVWGLTTWFRRAMNPGPSRVPIEIPMEVPIERAALSELNRAQMMSPELAELPESGDGSDLGRSPVFAPFARSPISFLLLLLIGSHLFLLGWSTLASRHNGLLRVTFLDVGQGDASVIETPSGRTIVVDAGGMGATEDDDEGRRVVAPFLRYSGINRINVLVLTHPHADHIGGAATLMKRFRVDQLIDNGQDTGDREVLTQVLTAAQERGVPHSSASPGHVLDCGDGVTIEELAPSVAEISGPPNNASVVLRLTYGRTTFLFTGDAEMSEEGDLLQSGNRLDCDVLKAGHHGSRTSTTPAFLAATHPHWAILSVGKHNLYGHPNAEVISRLQASGATVYRTDLNGAVTFRSDGVVVSALPLYTQ